MAANIGSIPDKIDLVFASEYFEHWEDPIAHLQDVLKVNPRYLLIQNSFGSLSVGHFLKYKRSGTWVCRTKIGRQFNAYLRGRGYSMVKFGCWNNRPSFWILTRTPKADLFTA